MFCKHCGNELLENAVVCRKCGCMADGLDMELHNETPQIMAVEQQKKPSRKFFRLTRIFSIVATSVGGLSLFFGLCFLFMLLMSIAIGEGGGLVLAIYSIFGLLAMIGCSPFALVSGILAFVFKNKAEEPTGGFPVFAFVFGIVAFVISWGTYWSLIIQ